MLPDTRLTRLNHSVEPLGKVVLGENPNLAATNQMPGAAGTASSASTTASTSLIVADQPGWQLAGSSG